MVCSLRRIHAPPASRNSQITPRRLTSIKRARLPSTCFCQRQPWRPSSSRASRAKCTRCHLGCGVGGFKLRRVFSARPKRHGSADGAAVPLQRLQTVRQLGFAQRAQITGVRRRVRHWAGALQNALDQGVHNFTSDRASAVRGPAFPTSCPRALFSRATSSAFSDRLPGTADTSRSPSPAHKSFPRCTGRTG